MGNIFKPDKRIHLDEKNHKYILQDNKDIVFTSVFLGVSYMLFGFLCFL